MNALVLEFEPHSGFGPLKLGSAREDARAAMAAIGEIAAAADESGHHEFDPLEYCFPNQILTLWSADPQYDYRRKGARQVWGAVGLGNEVYLSAIKALENDS